MCFFPRLQESGITLNPEKCSFLQSQVRFLGKMSSAADSSDPEKVSAVLQMRKPTSVPEIRHFLGIINQLSKCTPNIAEKTKPLRDLLLLRNQWIWEELQWRAFNDVKNALVNSSLLASFDPGLETTVSADASFCGIGGILLQTQKGSEVRPVAYISRVMTPTKQRYAQIKKEALMRGGRLVIPMDLQPGVLRQLHCSHQGISKCRERARQLVWWPRLSKQFEDTVHKCPVCIKFKVPRTEPLMFSKLPSLP